MKQTQKKRDFLNGINFRPLYDYTEKIFGNINISFETEIMEHSLDGDFGEYLSKRYGLGLRATTTTGNIKTEIGAFGKLTEYIAIEAEGFPVEINGTLSYSTTAELYYVLLNGYSYNIALFRARYENGKWEFTDIYNKPVFDNTQEDAQEDEDEICR
ncbi:MAG: hypothetical protein LBI44_07840 [Oscillospiraceae bacterium]|nr:hypothetical protein [Oscillospiraceae bacterium]